MSGSASTNTPQQEPVALITGGASRIGRAVALQLARAGFDIAITHHANAARAADVCSEIADLGRNCAKFPIDFSSIDAVEECHKQFLRYYGRLDVLVNNASVFFSTPVQTLSAAEFERTIRINAMAPLLLSTRFADLLGARYDEANPQCCGRIVNFVDIHVLGEPLPGFSAYNASKAALLEITKTLAVELAPRITVNAIAPGVIGWAEFHTEEYRKAFLQRVPMAREGTPEEAAKAVLFLVRDGTYCNGQVIRIDGGRLLT